MDIVAKYLTQFADQAVLLPLSAFLTIVFCMTGWWRGAKGWLLAIVGMLTAVVISKVVFFILASRLPFELASPSTHVAAGGMVYGCLLALLLRGGRTNVRTAIISTALFAVFFGATRLQLNVHSEADVVVGLALGLGGTFAFFKLAAATMPREFHRWRIALGAVLIVLATYGHQIRAEPLVHAKANDLRTILKKTFSQN